MGWFGSYDFNKGGPGVEKNERKKKGFFSFFEIYFRNFWRMVGVNVVYVLMSVVGLGFTNGLAKAGMTHVARSIGREKHSFLLSDFFETIKKNWKQSLIMGILNMFAMAILGFDLYYFWGYVTNVEEFGLMQIIGLGVSAFLAIVLTFIKYYIWTMTITFSLTIKQMLKNSFQFVFLNIWRNIMIAVIMGVLYVGAFLLASLNAFCLIIACFLAICVIPGFKAILIQANVFPQIKKYMIDPYYEEHKGEDIEKRRALGLEIPEDELNGESPEEESVFSDEVPDVKKEN